MNQNVHEVLLVYKQIEMQFDETGTLIVPDDYKLIITVSYDEKPGIQAISTLHQIYVQHQDTAKYTVMQNTNVLEPSFIGWH